MDDRWDVKDDPAKIWRCLSAVNENVSMAETLREWGLELKETSSESFLFKTRCPLPGHVGRGPGGRERTPSFCVSSVNRFYCFGCGRFGGIVDLISLVHGIPPMDVLRDLAKRIGLLDEDGNWDEERLRSLPERKEQLHDPMRTVDPYVMRANAALRDHVRSFLDSPGFDREFKWLERMGAKIDELLENIGYEDWEYAKAICDQVLTSIARRQQGEA